MRNIKMTIRYDGSRYKGFQRLKDNDMTIQGKIEDVLSKMANESIEIIGSGRTDMGVHAYGQVANFNYISSLNFRISREIKGCSNCMINELIKNNNSIYNTLLISPPGMRKDDIVAWYNTKY